MNKRKYLFLLLIIPILVIFISRSFSLTYTQEIKSVEIQSNDYNNPGSWHIDKSAEWIGLGKARVTFDVNSVVKTSDARYKDVIFVMDVSGSMSGSKLDRAKQDAIDLTNYLLSDSHNSVALITFDSTSEVISGFTNNKQEMIEYITNLNDKGCTNYNAGLLNVETVMRDYVKSDNKDLLLLFLTDGYPNIDTPNQVATYGILKEKYPYMTINGIQYEMGKEIIKEIIEISDNQFIANQDTLNNVLFDATVTPTAYDNFVVTDYVNDEYFYIESVNDIKVPFGEVSLDTVNGVQKITWDLGNNYVTGRNVKMTIDLKLKEEFHNTRGFYPTNKSETIVSKLPDEQEKTRESELTPVLKNVYEVIYNPNTPDGCTLPSIENEEYMVYQTVTKRSDSLTCPGYIFKGWYVDSNDLIDIKFINDDMFIMPPHDVHIRGTWTKQDLVKTMDGTVKVKLDGTLMKHDNIVRKTFGKDISRNSFESITTVADITIPSTALDFWDASAEQNGSVLAWYTDVDNNGMYELYIGQEDGVKANPNSSYAFYYFSKVNSIDLSNFDTSRVTNMAAMFSHTAYISTTFNMDLGNLNTSNVKNMAYMFHNSGFNATTWNIGNISNWDTSNVTDMSSMFNNAGRNATTWNIGSLNNWNTSKVTNMASMFYYAGFEASEFNLDLNNWNTSKVTDMSSMFNNAGKKATTWNIGNLSTWNISNVTNMYSMFEYAGFEASEFNLDLNNWNTSKVTDMSSMFNNAGKKATTWNIGNLSTWNISNVTNMYSMFEYAGHNSSSFELDLSNWDTLKVTNMASMFYYSGNKATTWNIGALDNWNTSSVTTMSHMFYNAGGNATTWNIGNINTWDVSSVTDMSYMFYYSGNKATTWNIGNISTWDVSSVTTMSNMFNNAGYSATTWNIGDLINWNISMVTNMNSMFAHSGYRATTWNIGNLSNWDTSKVIDMSYMFERAGCNATTWNIGDISNWNTSSVTNMNYMFSNTGYKATSWNIGNLSNWDTSKVTNMSNMFARAGNSATTWNIGNLDNWDTSRVTNMSSMFYGAGNSATTWNIGNLSNWDTSKVTNMSEMFRAAGQNSPAWSIGDLSNWDVSSVTNMSYMFEASGYKAVSWSIGDLSNWDTSSVTNMYSMFAYSGHITQSYSLNIGSWDVSSVANMSQMFRESGYNSIAWNIGDLSNWDTSNVTNMSSMFYMAGATATTWNSVGTLKVYARTIDSIFLNCVNAKATLNIYSNPTSYSNAFSSAAMVSGSGITVNYSSATTNIDNIIATKSNNSNVVKGEQLD